MTSVEQKQQTPLPNRLSVDTKVRPSEVQQAPKSASTAGSNSNQLSTDLKNRAVTRAQEYLYASPNRHHHQVVTSSPTIHHHQAHYHASPVAHSASAGYVQYQPPSYEVVETHTAQREREVTVEVPQYRTYVHYQPEAYEVTETHTAQREKEVTVEVPHLRTYVHYQPEAVEVTETHVAQREKEVTVEIPKYTTYHTYKPEAYEIIETHSAVREKEVTVEVPEYKEYTYCTPEKRETVYDYIAPKEHVVYNPVQTVSYRLVTDYKAHGKVMNTSAVTIVNSPHEFHSMVKSATASPVKRSVPVSVPVERVKTTSTRAVEVVEEAERCHGCGQTVPGQCQHCGQRKVAKETEKRSAPRREEEEEQDDVNASPKKLGKRREVLDNRSKKNTK